MKMINLLKASLLALLVLTTANSAFAQFGGGGQFGPGGGRGGPGGGRGGPGPGPGPGHGPGGGGHGRGNPGQHRGNDILNIGETLLQNQALYSPSGEFQLIMQADCNLVLYSQSRFGQQALWSSRTNTSRNPSNCRATFQQDNNFVVYDFNGKARWASNTRFRNAQYLVMQDDGNAVIYATGGNAVWASNTAR